METDQRSTSPFLELNGMPVYFKEDWDTGIGGGLWSTGLAISKYFQSHTALVRRNLERLRLEEGRGRRGDRRHGLSVLELGSGNGFLSVCLLAVARDMIEELVVTDRPDHLPLIERTIVANSHLTQRGAPRDKEEGFGEDENCDGNAMRSEGKDGEEMRMSVLEHRWGEFVDISEGCCNGASVESALQEQLQRGTKKFDFIFGSDLAYRDELYAPLISYITQFSHDRTVALIGVTMNDTKPKFFSVLREAGFRYDRLADHLLEPEFRGTTFGLIAIQRA